MRKLLVLSLITIFLLPIVLAIPNQSRIPEDKIPDLKKMVFIHWKKGFAKPPCDSDGVCEVDIGENPSCSDCKASEEEPTTTTTCYAFMGQYGKRFLKWKTLPVNYEINPYGLDSTFVTNAISASAEVWDADTGAELFSNTYITSNREAGVQDYVNVLAWGNYPTEGVIGVATVWYNPATKTIVEFDVMFDTDWNWGDAATNPSVMDLQNIATHELGHGVGLEDVYENECSEVTMYGYSDYGETEKRTLATPDITGLQTLYGK